jgi:hypothetical protein
MMLGSGNSYYTKKSQRAAQQEVEMPLYGILGAVAGLIIGGFAGNEIEESNKKKKVKEAEVNALRTEINKAAQIEANIDAAIGINNLQEVMFKDGRYWKVVTTWTDPRDNSQHELITLKKNGTLITELDGVLVVQHVTESASKAIVPGSHSRAKLYTFNALRKAYQDQEPGTM